MSLTTRSVVEPLLFHKVHEENVRLMNDRTVAFRHEGYNNGLAFSDRPIRINEAVYIRILDVSKHLSGALRIGFTINDPETFKCNLTHFTSPDYATSINGYWEKALADRYAKKYSTFYYFVDYKGYVHCGIDSENCCILFGGVNTSKKLWALLNIYGSTRSVELLNPFMFNDEMTLMPFLTKLNYNMVFHAVHGRNVRLNSSRNIVTMKRLKGKESYTFTDRSLRLEEKLVIKVRSTNFISINFVYGVTSCNPSTLVPELLPDNPVDLVNLQDYWVVKDDTHSYSRGDFIVYSLNSEGKVTVSKNNLFETAQFYVDITQPLWGFFNISGNISELEIMGTFPSAETHNDTSELEQEQVPSIPPVIDDSFPEEEPTNEASGTSGTFPSAETHNDTSELEQEQVPSIPPVIDDSFPKEEPTNEASGTSGEQEHTKCAICSEGSVKNAVYSCGHLCLCDDCGLNVMKYESNVQFCPICGEPIKDVFEIFL